MLMYAGKHAAKLLGYQPKGNKVLLHFATLDGRGARQVLSNTQFHEGLRQLGMHAKADHLLGRNCWVQVERVTAEPGVEVARVIACGWSLEALIGAPLKA